MHTDSFYPRGLEAAQYIGRYLGHPPLATSHLSAYDGQQVTYWYIDTATSVRQTITCSALDFISRLVPHMPPQGMQLVRYAGLYARSIKQRCAELAHTALEAIRIQLPLFALEPLRKVLPNPKWRERITPSGPPSPRWGDGQGQASYGYDPLACPWCATTMQLAEIWEPKRGHVWMRRWLETHRATEAKNRNP